MAGDGCCLMEIVADLHMHSTSSDGRYAPSIILDKVVNAGLSTFALSDHDTINHIPIINACIESKRIDIQFLSLQQEYHVNIMVNPYIYSHIIKMGT